MKQLRFWRLEDINNLEKESYVGFVHSRKQTALMEAKCDQPTNKVQRQTEGKSTDTLPKRRPKHVNGESMVSTENSSIEKSKDKKKGTKSNAKESNDNLKDLGEVKRRRSPRISRSSSSEAKVSDTKQKSIKPKSEKENIENSDNKKKKKSKSQEKDSNSEKQGTPTMSRSSSKERKRGSRTVSSSASKNNLSKNSEAEDKDHNKDGVSHSESSDLFYTDLDDLSLSEEDEMSEAENGKPTIQKIFAHREEKGSTEYLVKFKNRSYRHNEWIPEITFYATRRDEMLLSRYKKKHWNDPPKTTYYDPIYETPEKIIGSRDHNGETQYLVKWTQLEYDENTWETRESIGDDSMIQAFEKSNKLPPLSQRIPPKPPSPSEWRQITKVPKSKKGMSVRPYQLEGLNFLANSWFNHRNAILADEMGLGKTLQSLIFLDYLNREKGVHGPFLVIGPLSTIGHWEREIREWTKMSSIAFFGPKSRRQQMVKYEFFYPSTVDTPMPLPKFQILLTTYEYVIQESAVFSSIAWQAIVIDEAHRLKNHESKLLGELRKYRTSFKLLLTGTPLQNNTNELWSLLNYLDEEKFESMTDFQEKFGELSESDQILELQAILKPLMLRRLKGDVEKAIAPLEEVIIECAMTKYQKSYYQGIFNKNMEYLTRGAHRQSAVSLNNIFMELRKVCNHPYLLQGAEDQILIELRDAANIPHEDELPPTFEDDALIKTSGKMILLDKLLEKLKKDNHRVLIFSQMTRMLDILQDFLTYRGYLYERLDGSIKGDDRQAGIDRFNAPGSEVFVFLLCTHAGGLGINLTSADTVIIYDSDWNPQNDIQATARCHRIGQTKEVKVYRFITAKSYERKMFDRAAIKLGLDHAVLESSKAQKTEDLEKLLRLGAYYAFEDEGGEEAEKFGVEDIDSIISRSTKIRHENLAAGDGSTFSKATFEIDDDEDGVDISAPDFWQKYLPEVVEDEDWGVSIAERRRLKREIGSIEPLNTDMISTAQLRSNKDFTWTKKKIQILMCNLWRFGWGRWRVIYEHGKFACEVGEVKAVSRCILSWLCDAAPNQFPLMEAILRRSASDETAQFEQKFIKKRYEELYPIVAANATWRLSRLEQLHFLNSAVQTCENPPDELVVPHIPQQKPAPWWTATDDKLLMHGIYAHGFGLYEEIKFTQDEPIQPKALTNRIKAIIIGLKNSYIRYKEEKGADVPFNYETLRAVQDAITKKDHKQIVYILTNFGFTTFDEFRLVSGMDYKTPALIDKYVNRLIMYCQYLSDTREPVVRKSRSAASLQSGEAKADENEDASKQSKSDEKNEDTSKQLKSDEKNEDTSKQTKTDEKKEDEEKPEKPEVPLPKELEEAKSEPLCSKDSPEEAPWIAEKIMSHQAHRIISRIRFFEKLRENCDNPKYSEVDREIVCFVAEHGYIDLLDNPILRDLLEEEVTEAKISKRVKSITQMRAEKKVRESKDPSEKSVTIPTIQYDENGEPAYPIQLTPSASILSMGKVVYDRAGFHCSRYIYPDGYEALRMYTSVQNPPEKAWYRCTISDSGSDYPLFRVELQDNPEIGYEGFAPSTPWINIIKDIEEKMHTNRAMTISGPDYFNLTHPVTLFLMGKMENADKCANFHKRNFTEDGREERSAENFTQREPRPQRNRRRRWESKEIEFDDESDEDSEDIEKELADDEESKPKRKRGPPKSRQLLFDFTQLLQSEPTEAPSLMIPRSLLLSQGPPGVFVEPSLRDELGFIGQTEATSNEEEDKSNEEEEEDIVC